MIAGGDLNQFLIERIPVVRGHGVWEIACAGAKSIQDHSLSRGVLIGYLLSEVRYSCAGNG